MTADQAEARAERRAICEADRVPEETIKAIFRAYPSIYGYDDEAAQGEMF